ncbi:MAG: pyridoxal phosphate-dependent aminotransferase [Bacillota bacterium]|nr:pyridoxal phosphate-dependent aminotransferase [Bacillota bacterium]
MISKKIAEDLRNASFIRAMFEEGEKLRRTYGPEKVYDFSLGNPDNKPPEKVKKTLKNLILEDNPNLHAYMSNAGYPDVKAKVAAHVQNESGISLTGENIIMTCGAAGGLNVALKALLDPEDEVIIFAPFFVEYLFYVGNHGGKGVIVPTIKDTFEPDPAELEKHLSSKTKAIILNSPNNPTGVVYNEKILGEIAKVLEAAEKKFNTTIYVISDEPYTKIVYDGVKVPSLLKAFKNAISINSFSKSLALPGERIGYIAVSSAIDNWKLLIDAMTFTNRTLGFVNAPALFQKVIAEALDEEVDTSAYLKRRDMLYNHLISLGFECVKPQGAFYLFPKALIPDDVEFKNRALKYNLIIVPGKGFGCPGYFRLAYCISQKTIENSLEAFTKLAAEFR